MLARLTGLFTELRLPTIVLWPQFTEQADQEGSPGAVSVKQVVAKS